MGAIIFLTLFYSTSLVAQTNCLPNIMRYTVADAVPDPTVNVTPMPLGIWLDGAFCDGGQAFFSFNPGTFLDVFLDGTGAHLHGTATINNDPCGIYQGTTWDVSFFLDTTTDLMNVEPHLELFSGNQPASVTDEWVYFIIDSTSTISLGTEVIHLTHYPTTYQFAFQMGWTANGKNLDFGFSAWFEYDFNGRTGNGDIAGVLDSLCEGPHIGTPCPVDLTVQVSSDCIFNTALGNATAVVSNGTGNYSYLWSNDDSTASINNISNGTYSVTVFDENGCQGTGETTLNCAPTCQLHTQTMGGWGTSANGNNPGTYRDANFSKAFPKGITIGCKNTLKLTSSAAVQAFLPSTGTPSALSKNLTNPGQNYQNVLAGQLVAAKLNVGFDAYDPNFGSATTLLGNAYIIGGLFNGYTVNEVIVLADKKIGNCSGVSFTFSELNEVLSSINENFVDGSENHGFLSCLPASTSEKAKIENAKETKSGLSLITVYPNPINNLSKIEIKLDKEQDAQLQIFNINGVLLIEIFNGKLDSDNIHLFNLDGNHLTNGIYFLRFKSGEEVQNLKFVVTK